MGLSENDSTRLLNQLSNQAAILNDYNLGIVVEAAEYNLIKTLSPKIYKDGDQWCVLYGENLQDGVCGFGPTPYLAVLDFNKKWSGK